MLEVLRNAMQWYAGVAGESLFTAFAVAGLFSWLLAGEVHAKKNWLSVVIFLLWLFFVGSIFTAVVIRLDGTLAIAGSFGALIGAIVGAIGSQGQGGEEKKN